MSGESKTISDLIPGSIKMLLHHNTSTLRWRNAGSVKHRIKTKTFFPDFSRPYAPGDPLRFIDWRAYARSNQLIIREFFDEDSAKILVGIELSESMLWPGGEVAPNLIKKIDIALRVGLDLCYQHVMAGDILYFFIKDFEQNKTWLLKIKTREQPQAIFYSLQKNIQTKNFFSALGFTQVPNIESTMNANLVYWLSDGLSSNFHVDFLRLRQSACFIHILSSLELGYEWMNSGFTYFDKLKNIKEYIGSELMDANFMQNNVISWTQKLQNSTRQQNGHYLLLSDNSPQSHYFHFINHTIPHKLANV